MTANDRDKHHPVSLLPCRRCALGPTAKRGHLLPNCKQSDVSFAEVVGSVKAEVETVLVNNNQTNINVTGQAFRTAYGRKIA